MTLTTDSNHAPDTGTIPPLDGTSGYAGVTDRFRDVVAACPDRVAVTDDERAATYAELAVEAAAVRAGVLGAGLPPGTAVALLHDHRAGAVAALVGVVASGHPVVVLDARTPLARLTKLAGRTGAGLCVTDEANLETAQGLGLPLVRTADLPAAEAADLWADPPAADTAATLAFTSGSTGEPKVILLPHGMLLHEAWANGLGSSCYDGDDVIAHTLPLGFIAGVFATFGGITIGARLAMHDVRKHGIGGMAQWVAEAGATVVQASPAILRGLIATQPDPAHFAGLRSLTVAGEPVHGRDLEAARRLLPPDGVLVNRYGSSETGIISDFRLEPGDPPVEGLVPAGIPTPGNRIVIVEEDGTPVPAGEPGIVTVIRPNMALEYVGNPEATAKTWWTNPDGSRTCRTNDVGRIDEEGRLHLLGRRDHSVKIRGQMVEPAEVDAALFALPDVREALVMGVPRADDGRMRLIAYVVPAVERLGAAEVRAALRRTLPAYMVPEQVVFMDALPRTERGKLDRSALPPPPVVAPGSAGQELSEWEQVVADVWCRVLSLEDVGLADDFFELGGDSLAAERLISLLIEEFGVPDTATTAILVEHPTLARFAQRVTRPPAQGDDVVVPLRPSGSLPPLWIVAGGGGLGVAYVPLARHLDPEQPLWALQAHGMERRGLPDWSVQAIARRNVAAIRQRQPQGPYHLAGHSFGGMVALEMAHQLRRAGAEVGLLIMLDSFPPDPWLLGGADLRPMKERMRDLVGLPLTGLRGTPGPDQYWRFFRLSRVLHKRYRCEPWSGETLVVLADSPEQTARSMWEEHLTGDWRMVRVSGDHHSMLRESHVEETARVVAEGLREWREKRLAGGDRTTADQATAAATTG